jgi:hypothetical protein
MIVVFAWRDVPKSYMLMESLRVNVLEEEFPPEAVHFQKGF